MTDNLELRRARLLRVALTGGIATGKSYVLHRFTFLGVPTIDADRVAHEVVRCGEPAWNAVRERFGADILLPDGEIDRKRLGTIVFSDPRARTDLERIVHPGVRAAIEDWFRGLAAGHIPFGIADIPLLFEAGREHAFDRVIVVACAPERQVQRIIARDGLSEEAARQRLAAQMPIEVKTARADHVIRTDGTYAETDRQVDAVLEALRAAASEVQEQ